MDPKKYLLCITIPTLNRGHYLKRLIDSIVNQKGFTDDISIVINDGPSTDTTTEIVAEYQKKHANIFYTRNARAVGMLPAILESIDMSNGEYTWLFGSDDFMKEGSLEIVLQIILEKSPTLILSNRLVVDGELRASNYKESERRNLLFHGFSDFSVYLWFNEPHKYADKWNYLTFMSVFCFKTAYYRDMLPYVESSVCSKEALSKHYFNYIVVLFSQLSSEKTICLIEKPRLVFCQGWNTSWEPNHKINVDIKMLMNYLSSNYQLTQNCQKMFRRMYLESLFYGSILYKLQKVPILKESFRFLRKNSIAKKIYYWVTQALATFKL